MEEMMELEDMVDDMLEEMAEIEEIVEMEEMGDDMLEVEDRMQVEEMVEM